MRSEEKGLILVTEDLGGMDLESYSGAVMSYRGVSGLLFTSIRQFRSWQPHKLVSSLGERLRDCVTLFDVYKGGCFMKGKGSTARGARNMLD